MHCIRWQHSKVYVLLLCHPIQVQQKNGSPDCPLEAYDLPKPSTLRSNSINHSQKELELNQPEEVEKKLHRHSYLHTQP